MGARLRIFLTNEEKRTLFELRRATTVPQRVKDRAEVLRLNHQGWTNEKIADYEHWLAMAVAMLWMVTLGGEQEISDDKSIISDPLGRDQADRRARSQTASADSLSCFVNGLLTVVAQLLKGESLTLGRLFPLPLSHFNDLAFADSS